MTEFDKVSENLKLSYKDYDEVAEYWFKMGWNSGLIVAAANATTTDFSSCSEHSAYSTVNQQSILKLMKTE